ncbi:hypothetical protein [Streptomyces californicus]|uniref:hypothetical protein n=1 Tax=Streptomyces californicus TaxID=67351 RepID=UPI0036AEF02C
MSLLRYRPALSAPDREGPPAVLVASCVPLLLRSPLLAPGTWTGGTGPSDDRRAARRIT